MSLVGTWVEESIELHLCYSHDIDCCTVLSCAQVISYGLRLLWSSFMQIEGCKISSPRIPTQMFLCLRVLT